MRILSRIATIAALVLLPAVVVGIVPQPALAEASQGVHGHARSADASSAAIWAACGWSSPENKVVRVFPMKSPIPGAPPLTATLYCGNDRHGYFHIANGHGMDWQNIAFYTGENWRFLADFAIEQILTVPEPGYPVYRKENDTWSYRAPLEIRDSDGVVRASYHPIVTVAARDGKIITAFPSR